MRAILLLSGVLALAACPQQSSDEEARQLGCPPGDQACIEERRRLDLRAVDLPAATDLSEGDLPAPDLAGSPDLAGDLRPLPDLAGDMAGPMTVVMSRHRISDACGPLNAGSVQIKPGGATLLGCLNPAAGPPSTCQETFPAGTVVELTFTPLSGVRFNGWTGACAPAGMSRTCTLSGGGTKNVGFDLGIDGLVVDKTGGTSWSPATNAVNYAASGFSIMVPSFCQTAGCCALYAATTRVTLTRSAGDTTWGGACAAAGVGKTCTITVSGRMEVTHAP